VARNKSSWTEAQSYCKSAGGDLVSILDEGEQAFVYSLLPECKIRTHCIPQGIMFFIMKDESRSIADMLLYSYEVDFILTFPHTNLPNALKTE
jgi:hypothetical protein